MIKIAICDDDDFYAKRTKEAILKASASRERKIEIEIFRTSVEILKTVDRKAYDIIFMDIELENQILGTKVAYKIKRVYPESLIVYISAYDNYFSEMVRHELFGFLHKPLNLEQLEEVLLDAYARLEHCEMVYEIVYKGVRSLVRIRDIVCACSDRHRCKIITKDAEYTFYKKLDELERELSYIYPYFIRANKSYLVNYFQIRHIIKNDIIITYNGLDISISYSYKENFYKKYDNIH